MSLPSRLSPGPVLRASLLALAAMTFTPSAFAQQPPMDKQIGALLAEQKWGEALMLIDAELKAKPNDTQLLMNRGAVLSNLNRNNDALATFQKVAQINPQLPAAHNNIAVILAAMGRYDEAKVSLERAIRTHPTYATAYENLGDLYSHMAGDAYRKALQIDKNLKTAKPKLEMVSELTALAAGGAPSSPRPASPLPAEPVAVAQAPAPVPAAAARPPAEAPKPTPAVAAAPAPAARPPAPAPVPAPAPAAAPAPAPAAAPAPAPKPAPAAQEQPAEVEAALKAWASAWSARDIDAYAAAYVPTFKGSSSSHAEWLAERRARILARSHIDVSVSDVKVKLDGESAAVNFLQSYSSDGPRVRSRKSIAMQKVGGKWLIREESGR